MFESFESRIAFLNVMLTAILLHICHSLFPCLIKISDNTKPQYLLTALFNLS